MIMIKFVLYFIFTCRARVEPERPTYGLLNGQHVCVFSNEKTKQKQNRILSNTKRACTQSTETHRHGGKNTRTHTHTHAHTPLSQSRAHRPSLSLAIVSNDSHTTAKKRTHSLSVFYQKPPPPPPPREMDARSRIKFSSSLTLDSTAEFL